MMVQWKEIDLIFLSCRYDIRNINVEIGQLANGLFDGNFKKTDIGNGYTVFAVSQ